MTSVRTGPFHDLERSSTHEPRVPDSGLDALRQAATAILNDDVQLAALTDLPVLITAERRDQRETYARLIHTNGNRRHGPFVAFSDGVAGAIAGNSSLSAATYPDRRGSGLRHQFDVARGGTLFVDDITRLTPDVQAQLLGLLELAPALRPSVDPGRLGVRVIAGASRHLRLQRATGAFCEPLFYRLNIVHIALFPAEAAENI